MFQALFQEDFIMGQETAAVLEPEDQILAYTHTKRKEIVNALMKNGSIPDDTGMARVLVSTLDGMDKAALGRKRVKLEERQTTNQEHAAGVIAHILGIAAQNRSSKVEHISNRQPPVLGAEVPEPVLVPGETSILPVSNLSYETFVAAEFDED
jgi:hypothetical protein